VANYEIRAKALKADTRPEVELLLCCARTCIDSEIAERIRTLLQQDIDWAYLLQIAYRNGVLGLLHRSLNSTCKEAVPKAILGQLQSYCYANAARNVFLSSELLKLLNLFETHNIRAIPYKGLVLAASAYGNLELRQFCDLDILVHKRDFLKAKELLILHGYSQVCEQLCEISFVDKDSKVKVDLHQAIAPNYFPFPLDFDRLWERLQPLSLNGVTVNSLSSEDLLLLLCVYLAKDCFNRERLAQLCDIAELIRSQPEIDWGRVIEQAHNLGTERIFFLGIFLAHQLLGTTLPEEVLQKVQAQGAVTSLSVQVCQWLLADADKQIRVMQRLLFYWRVRERLQDIVPFFTYYTHQWIAPNETDRAFLSLPASLSFLYYMLIF
jgi:hypothetical protein